jgi:hypothetical protein
MKKELLFTLAAALFACLTACAAQTAPVLTLQSAYVRIDVDDRGLITSITSRLVGQGISRPWKTLADPFSVGER